MEKINLVFRNGGGVSYELDQVKTPRALLAVVYEGLAKGAYRFELLQLIQRMERHLGLELGAVRLDRRRRARRCGRP